MVSVACRRRLEIKYNAPSGENAGSASENSLEEKGACSGAVQPSVVFLQKRILVCLLIVREKKKTLPSGAKAELNSNESAETTLGRNVWGCAKP